MSYAAQARDLERIKLLLMGRKGGNGLLATMMFSLNTVWDPSVATAAIDGVSIYWNPDWYMKLPDETKQAILRHELDHSCRGHSLRMDTRDHKRWNMACDYVINNGLIDEGFTFAGVNPLVEPNWRNLSEEQIYDLIPTNQLIPDDDDRLDLRPTPAEKIPEAVARLAQAQQAAAASGEGCGDGTDVISLLIKKYRNPKIRWQDHLHRFLQDMGGHMYSYGTPNRRVIDHLVPGKRIDYEGRLDTLMYFIDMSYSTSDEEVIQFLTEIKAVRDEYEPEKLIIACFDTEITQVLELDGTSDMGTLELEGRGGTCLVCVHDMIEKYNPTAAIIFSDMEVDDMEPLKTNTPVVWAVVRNPHYVAPFGTVIHLEVN